MTGKSSIGKKQPWMNVLFVILFFGIASLFIMPAEAQTAQVNVDIPGRSSIEQVLPNLGKDQLTKDSKDAQKDEGLARADALVRNIIKIVLRILQFAAVAYIVVIGAQIVTHVGNEDLLEKKRPAIAYAIIGFIVMSIGDNALEVFNPANYNATGPLASQLMGQEFWKVITNAIDVIRYAMWIMAVTLVVLTGYRMIISQDKEITKSRQQLVWIGVGLFVIQIADFIIKPFLPENSQKLETGSALVANIANVMLTFFAPAAFFFFLYGAFVLVTANGDDAKVKTARNILVGTVIAVILTFSSYMIIQEVVKSFTAR